MRRAAPCLLTLHVSFIDIRDRCRTAIDLPTLPTDFSILDQLKQRIELAKQVDQAHHKLQKQAHDDKWLREAAEAMEVDLDDDDNEYGSACPPPRLSFPLSHAN